MKIKGHKKVEGISLIVLVITIIVIIILAAAVILTLLNNNLIEEANKARYKSDRDNMQSVFTNTVAKVMAVKQSSIKIEAGQLNNVKSGVNSTTGIVNYEIENGETSNNKKGTIEFDNKENEENRYYTGKKLPIYKAGETTWNVNEEGILKLQVGTNEFNDSYNDSKNEENKDNVVISKEEYNNLLSRLEELEKRAITSDSNLYTDMVNKINKLESKTTMKTLYKNASNVSIRGDSVVVKVLSIEIPEDCYADVFASSNLLKNSDRYNSIGIQKNGTTICSTGKGGEGYTVKDSLNRSIELKKGDIISVMLYQSTGVTTTANVNLVINYFPI